ncbi:MAG TPA: potassium channel family protein [Gemmatimonadales bacterium]|nr:potassium channel family protein [Gemmatimonadales bacterium]
MRILLAFVAIALLLLVLRDAFETVILPRRVHRRFRPTSLFYRSSWLLWRGAALRLPKRFREASLGWFGPSSLLVLLALWAVSIVFAFGALHWAAGSAIELGGETPGFLTDLYFSGTTFFTLGLGDAAPRTAVARVLTVSEAGLGVAFLAITIGYLPVIYQTFSRREIAISLLDARAGSPPTAGELLSRARSDSEQRELTRLLADWERWAAELLESHISYPVLAYYRSQHSNQSWLAALTTVLDTSALVLVGFDGWSIRQAEYSFAMARHAVVDLAQMFSTRRPEQQEERLTDAGFGALVQQLDGAGIRFQEADARARLAALRSKYEPYVIALSRHLALPLPAWTRQSDRRDNWQAAPWKTLPTGTLPPEHFDSPGGL